MPDPAAKPLLLWHLGDKRVRKGLAFRRFIIYNLSETDFEGGMVK